MGRILRTGVDTVINYTLQSTSAYDDEDPAATTGVWPDSDAMDQLFDQTSPTVVEDEQGALVTFQRFPDRFLGVMVKVVANYDTELGESPALELWTHSSETDEWTPRRRRLIANVFTGSPSGKRKVYDFTLFPALLNVDQVWITMDPGDTGSPTLDWYSIQLFGQCETAQRTDQQNDPDPCADPTGPFYPGDDICNEIFSNPPPECAEPDWCNEASIQDYRACLEANVPEFLPIFDTWLDANREGLNDFCAGTQPFPDPPAPEPPTPNPLPPLDLCDEDSIEAFRAAVSGDEERLAQFDDYIDGLEDVGFFDLVCPDEEPPEEYVDPETGEPDDEPPIEGPFGAGPGGQPPFPRPPTPEEEEGGGGGTSEGQAWVLVSNSGYAGLSGGGCSVENGADFIAGLRAACTSTATLFCDISANTVDPAPDEALASVTLLCCGVGQFIVTASTVLFTRLRFTFDGGISAGTVTLETVSDARLCFTQAVYDAIVNPRIPKILLNAVGLPDPDFSTANFAEWSDVDALGNIDFDIVDSYMPVDPDGCPGVPFSNAIRYVGARITATTEGTFSDLLLEVQ